MGAKPEPARLCLRAGEGEKNISAVQEYSEISKDSSCLLSQDIPGSLTSHPCFWGREDGAEGGNRRWSGRLSDMHFKSLHTQVVRGSDPAFDLFLFCIIFDFLNRSTDERNQKSVCTERANHAPGLTFSQTPVNLPLNSK